LATTFQQQKKTFQTRCLLLITALCLVFFVTGILFGAMIPEWKKRSILAHFHTHSTASYNKNKVLNGVETEGTQCGNTWEEAKAMGCKFDVMASRWYAPECFFQEVLDEMMAEPWINFTWYINEDHTEIFPSEKAMAGEFVHVYPDGCELHLGPQNGAFS
jgi:hypothetical protein